MTKLIKTNLLKNNNTSDLAKITASTKDYCNYRYQQVIGEDMSFKNIFVSFLSALLIQFTLIGVLFVKLTGGLIFYPYWIIQQNSLKRKILREVKAENKTIDELNKFAKEIEENSK